MTISDCNLNEMTKYVFSSCMRKICVNRSAIEYNLKHGTNYPTILVLQDNFGQTIQEFHVVKVTNGVLSFDPNAEIKVCIESNSSLTAYRDNTCPTFLNATNLKEDPQKFSFLVLAKTKFLRTLGYVPVVSCFIPKKYIET